LGEEVLMVEQIQFKRARGNYLYDRNGRRYLDLSRDGGRMLFGHRTSKLIHETKNTLQKGILSPLNSPEQIRLFSLAAKLFPNHHRVFFYRAPAELEGLPLYRPCSTDPLPEHCEYQLPVSGPWAPRFFLLKKTFKELKSDTIPAFIATILRSGLALLSHYSAELLWQESEMESKLFYPQRSVFKMERG
jgi:hypothetical protein